MKVFDGKGESKKILEKLKTEIQAKKLKPRLAVFLIGDDQASHLYVNLKKRIAEDIGVAFNLYTYEQTAREDDIIKKIQDLNDDTAVNGILIQLPLPEGFNTEKIIASIDPRKDADGFHNENIRALKNGEKIKMNPVLPKVLLHALFASGKEKTELQKRTIKALVNSRLFGDTLRLFFSCNGVALDFFVAKNASVSEVRKYVHDADVVISVLGKIGSITGDMLKKEVILIDSGITKKDNRVFGDFDFESCAKKASFITPVPGGIGPMTIAFLFENTVTAELKKNSLRDLR